MSSTLITIAICTWNRSRSLHNALASLQRMHIPREIEWEVLVVDNNCTDDTNGVIASFSDNLPIRPLLEAQQGLSHARNRAVDAAQGSYILWTDDDVIVSEQWLKAYVDAFRAWPDAAVFGGPILPTFEGKPQSWLITALQDKRIADAYAARDLGVEQIELELDASKLPYGANFAVRMEEQRKFPYDPRLGVHKRGNIRGEEITVIGRILAHGAGGRWVPNASVRHVIPKDRQTEVYLRNYFVGLGRTLVRIHGAQVSTSYIGVSRSAWRAAILALSFQLCYLITRPFCSSKIWCQNLRRASIAWGRLMEYREINRTM